MKKKLVLLASTCVLSVGALTFVLANSEKLSLSNNDISSIDSSVFTLAKDSIIRSATDPDVTEAVLLSSGNNSVNTTFKRAAIDGSSLVCDANDYITWSNNSDSPIRGISNLFFAYDAIEENQLQFWFYTSFNPLTLDNILAGDYQDLKVKQAQTFSYGSDYTDTFSYTFSEVDSRYFLAVVMCKFETHFTGFSISTPCDEEPTRDDPSVGKYSYPQDLLDAIPSEAQFPYVGNGSFHYEVNSGMVMVNFLEREAQMYGFVAAIGEAGYVYSNYLDGAHVYQLAGAPDNKYYTIVIFDETVTYGDLNYGRLLYYGEQPYMGPSVGWPEADLATHFSNNDLLALLSHNPGYDENYQFAITSDPSDNSRYAAVISGGIETTEEAYEAQSNLIAEYRDYIIDLDKYILIENEFYNDESETEVNIRASIHFVSEDLTHSVNVYLSFVKTSDYTNAVIRYIYSEKIAVTSFASYFPTDFFSKLQNPSFANEKYFLLNASSYSGEEYENSYVTAVSNTITASEVAAYYDAFDGNAEHCYKNTYMNSDGSKTYAFNYYDSKAQVDYSYEIVVGEGFVKFHCYSYIYLS